jgi:hypothetical protein
MKVRVALLLGVVAGLLAACGSPSAQPTPSDPGTTSGTVETSSPQPVTTVSVTTAPAPSTTTTMAPITGYGDFTGIRYRDIEWDFVTALTLECAQDQGMPLVYTSDGEGISFENVPLDQNATAGAVLEACRAGLNVADPEPLTIEDVEKLYDHLVAMVPCLESFGLTIPEPPSKDVFLDTYPNCVNCIIYHEWWDPFANVYVGFGGMDRDRYDEIKQSCPRTPSDW